MYALIQTNMHTHTHTHTYDWQPLEKRSEESDFFHTSGGILGAYRGKSWCIHICDTTDICIYIYMYMYACTHTNTHTHTHTHTHTSYSRSKSARRSRIFSACPNIKSDCWRTSRQILISSSLPSAKMRFLPSCGSRCVISPCRVPTLTGVCSMFLFMCLMWLGHTCDMSICVTWLSHMCDMTQSYVWHEYMCDMTQTYVWHGCMCDMTQSYVWHDSFICGRLRDLLVSCINFDWVLLHVHICHIAHLCVSSGSFVRVTWPSHTCDVMTHTCQGIAHSYTGARVIYSRRVAILWIYLMSTACPYTLIDILYMMNLFWLTMYVDLILIDHICKFNFGWGPLHVHICYIAHSNV